MANVTFLSTLPCPTFNTRFHIEFLGKTLMINEPNYDAIPDKNQKAISVLFDVLDLRTIIHCWKAMLLEKTVVLVSESTQLQFYVV